MYHSIQISNKAATMQLPIAITMLVGLAAAAPVSEYGKVLVTKDFFPESLVIYSGEHEIVNLYVPINGINFKEEGAEEDPDKKVVLFFVEADEVDGKRVDRGLYVFKDGVPKKILEHGRDVASANDYETDVYLAAADGIYWYDHVENTALKFGSVTDSIIGIAKETDSDNIYILTEDKQVYRVSEGGTKKEKVEEIEYAEQIVIDYENNLYFYDAEKQPYVYNENGVKKVEGVPKGAKKVQFLRPPLYAENAAPFVADDKTYVVHADGFAEEFSLEFDSGAKPSAFSIEAALMQYYAIDKKIYEFDLVEAWMGGIYDVIQEIFDTYLQIVKMIVALNVFNWPDK